MPVLLAMATFSVVTGRQARALARLLPDLLRVRVPGEHTLQVTSPRRLAAVLGDFFAASI